MKKVLSLVLVIAMVMTMGVTAFATSNDVVAIAAIPNPPARTNGAAATVTGLGLQQTVVVTCDDGIEYTLPINWTMPTLAQYNPAITTEQTFPVSGVIDLTSTSLVISAPLTVNVVVTVTVNAEGCPICGDPNCPGAPGGGTPGTPVNRVPTTWRIVEARPDAFDGMLPTGEIYLPIRLTGHVGSDLIGSFFLEPGFTPDMFTWQRRNPANNQWVNVTDCEINQYDAMRMIHFDNSNVRLNVGRTQNTNGTIRDVELAVMSGRMIGVSNEAFEQEQVGVRIRTPLYMNRTGNTDVAFDLTLRIAGTNFFMGRVNLTVGNDRITVWDGDEEIAVRPYEYIRADETVRNLTIEAGEGVFFTRNITGGQSIYVAASLWTDNAADDLFQQHSELVDIIDIHHLRMNAANVTAFIERDNVYFVYNAQRQLIGTTADENLPFSTRYYLTTAQIAIGGVGGAEEAPAEEEDNGDPGTVPETGGDNNSGSTNVNFNPGTGR